MSYQTTLPHGTKYSNEQPTEKELPGKTWTVIEENGAFNVTLPLGFGKNIFIVHVAATTLHLKFKHSYAFSIFLDKLPTLLDQSSPPELP